VITIAYVISHPEYLQHWGILGMKWGKRNGPPYPLEDGAHSAAEQRANPSIARRAAKAVGRVVKATAKAVTRGEGRTRWSKSPRRLSDADLAQRIQRLKQEEEYRKLIGAKTRAQITEARLQRGRAFSSSFLTELGKRTGHVGEQTYKDLRFLITEGAKLPFKGISALASAQGRKARYDAKLAAQTSKDKYEQYMQNTDDYKARIARETERQLTINAERAAREAEKAQRAAIKEQQRADKKAERAQARANQKAERREERRQSREYWERLTAPETPAFQKGVWSPDAVAERAYAEYSRYQAGMQAAQAMMNQPMPYMPEWVDG